MDFIKKNLKNILIFVIILSAVFVGYSYFFPGTSTTSPLVAVGPTGGAGSTGGDLLALLLSLKSLKLDDTIFSDPTFRSLRNFGVEIPQEPVGRTNPFAPLPGSAAAQGPVITIGSSKTK